MDSVKSLSSSVAERAKVALKTPEPVQPKTPEPVVPTKKTSATEPAKSEFVPETKQQKVTLDPTAGQKAVTAWADVAKTLPATVSASSLQVTGGKSANVLFTKTEGLSTTTTEGLSTNEAAPAGATSGTSTQSKVNESAERIAQEQKKNGAAAGVRVMEAELEQRKNDPDFEEYRRQLLIAAEPTIQELGKQLQRQQQGNKTQEVIDAFASVSKIAKEAGPEATQRAARALASGMDDQRTIYEPGSPQTEALRQAFEKGEGGVEFATALSKELAAAGKTKTAEYVGNMVVEHVNYLRDDFNAKTVHVENLNRMLQKAIADAGPGLTQEQQNKIAEEFKAKYANDYKVWEDAAARLEPYLATPSIYSQLADDPKLPEEVRQLAQTSIQNTTEVIQHIGNTKAGAAWIAREMMKEAQGEKTLLAQMGDYAKDRKDLADKFAMAIGKGAAAAALEGAEKGYDTAKVMKGLENYASFFGLSKKGMKEVNELFVQFKPGMTDKQVAELSQQVNNKLLEVESGTAPFGADGARGQVLRGIGLAFSVASLSGDLQQFPEAGLAKQIKTIGDLISAGSDAGTLVLGAMGASDRMLSLAGKAGPVGSAIAGIAEGITAIDAFGKGEKGKALEAGLMSAGNLLLAAGALQGFPVAGQFAGAALVVAAVGAKLYNEGQDQQDVKELKQYLFGKVFENDPALQQAFLGADRQQINEMLAMGFTQRQLQDLARTYPSVFANSGGLGWEGIAELQKDFNLSVGELDAFLREVGAGDDATLQAFISTMDPVSGRGVHRSRADWVEMFTRWSDGEKDPHNAYSRAAQYLSTRPAAQD